MRNSTTYHRSFLLLVLILSLFLAACGTDNNSTPVPTQVTNQPTAPAQVNPTTTSVGPTAAPVITRAAVTTATSTTVPATAVVATATPVPPTVTSAPTNTPVPATKAPDLSPRYIESLRNRTYDSEIKLDKLYARNETYTANLIYYQSDGLRISGLMYVPNGPADKKYPVALVNHGFFPTTPGAYDSGWDTLRELMFFARNGYITIASDYRNYARSDKGDNDRDPGYVVDILNLIAAAKKLPQADPTKITIMGHSMGGEITLTAMVVNSDIKVAALFGTMSPDAAVNYQARIKWNDGKLNQKWIAVYGTPETNPDAYRRMSPLTYFNDVKVPTIIHVGNNDTTTPPEWSVKTRDALLAAGKKAELYTYPGQGHSLNSPAFEQAMARTLTFFNTAIGK